MKNEIKRRKVELRRNFTSKKSIMMMPLKKNTKKYPTKGIIHLNY